MSEVKCPRDKCNHLSSKTATTCQGCGHQVTFEEVAKNAELKKRLHNTKVGLGVSWAFFMGAIVAICITQGVFTFSVDSLKQFGKQDASQQGEEVVDGGGEDVAVTKDEDEKNEEVKAAEGLKRKAFEESKGHIRKFFKNAKSVTFSEYDIVTIDMLEKGVFKVLTFVYVQETGEEMARYQFECYMEFADEKWNLVSVSEVVQGDGEDK